MKATNYGKSKNAIFTIEEAKTPTAIFFMIIAMALLSVLIIGMTR